VNAARIEESAMMTPEDRNVVLRALHENLVNSEQILACVWDLESDARGSSWDRSLPLRLVAHGFMTGSDLRRLRARAALALQADDADAGRDRATETALLTPPDGSTEAPPAADLAVAKPSPIDHAVAVYLQQQLLVAPEIVQRAIDIQADYAPFGISLPLLPVLARLGALSERHLAEVRRVDFAALTRQPAWHAQAVPGYPILGKIAIGGCGTVFRAKQAFTSGQVALKILQRRHWGNRLAVDRFVEEGRLVTRFRHPNLVHGLASGVSPAGLRYTVIELVRGDTVDRMLRRGGPFPIALALNVLRQVAKALAYIHSEGYVHRDVKPENILVCENGHIRLCDFGLILLHGQQGVSPSETTAGTAAYMSPEQARGEGDLRASTDIYALGLSTYAMITGRCPFEGEDSETVLAERFRSGHGGPDLDSLPAPPAVVDLLRRMLQPDHNRRYGDTEELLKAVAELQA
jgi:hypothetical protein